MTDRKRSAEDHGEPQAPKEFRTPDPDADFFRSWGVGCGVLFLAFLLLWAFVTFFWLR